MFKIWNMKYMPWSKYLQRWYPVPVSESWKRYPVMRHVPVPKNRWVSRRGVFLRKNQTLQESILRMVVSLSNWEARNWGCRSFGAKIDEQGRKLSAHAQITRVGRMSYNPHFASLGIFRYELSIDLVIIWAQVDICDISPRSGRLRRILSTNNDIIECRDSRRNRKHPKTLT